MKILTIALVFLFAGCATAPEPAPSPTPGAGTAPAPAPVPAPSPPPGVTLWVSEVRTLQDKDGALLFLIVLKDINFKHVDRKLVWNGEIFLPAPGEQFCYNQDNSITRGECGSK